VNREKREKRCPRRAVAGEFAERVETCSDKPLRMPGIFLEEIQILGLRTKERVNGCQNQRLVRCPGIVRGQDNETADTEAGR
jgi:hypothetical protein